MVKKLSKSEMMSYLKRWAAVNREEVRLLRKTSSAKKLSQFFSLMASAHLLGIYKSHPKDIMIVQKRWQIIRRKLQSV